MGFPGGSVGKNPPADAGDSGSIPRGEYPLEKEMATHSCIIAWRIPWIEEPSRLQSMGSQESDMTYRLNYHQISCRYKYFCQFFLLVFYSLWYGLPWWLQFSSVQSLSHVQLFVTPWTAAHQASLSIANSQSLLKLSPSGWWCHPTISSSVVPFSSRLQSFPASGSFPMSWLFASGGQSIGPSASASVLPMTIQDWFLLGWTGLISLLSKGLSRVFSSTTVWKHQFLSTQLYGSTLTSIHDCWKNHSFD